MRPHQLNIGINHSYTSVSNHPSFESDFREETWKSPIDRCISDTFVVSLNEDILFSLSLTRDCIFFLTDYQSNEQVNGGYSILDEITIGSLSTIVFFIDGMSIGEAVLVWPLEEDLHLIINGVVFNKKEKSKH